MNQEKNLFLLQHAEKTLLATLNDAESLGQNSLYVAGVYLASLSACGAVILKTYHSVPLCGAAVIAGLYLLRCAKRFVNSALSAKGIKHPGNLISNLTKAPYDSMSLTELLAIEALGYDSRIKENAERNRETGKGLNQGIRDLLRFPIVFVAAWIVLSFILSLVAFR